MKKTQYLILLLVVIILFPLNTLAGENGWKLYDNFNSGIIDSQLWLIDDSSARISIEAGMVKFEHDLRVPNDSSYLIFNKNPQKIKAIRAKVKIVADTLGDPRARIGGYIGRDEFGNRIWHTIGTRSEYQRNECYAGAYLPPNDDFQYDVFYAHFMRPLIMVDEWYTLEIEFNRNKLQYKASDLGIIKHWLPIKVFKSDDIFKGIGTRNGYDPGSDGPFVVYFDDVYVKY
jgi:hypothetical protein